MEAIKVLVGVTVPGQVVSQSMEKTYCITLGQNDLGQLLEGLESRADSWEQTGRYLLHGDHGGDDLFIVEECHKPEEAFGIAEHYRTIIGEIRSQMKKQD